MKCLVFGSGIDWVRPDPIVVSVRLWKTVKGPDPRRSMYAFVGLAMHLRQLGRFPESEAAFEDAIEFSSKFPPQARAFHDTAVEQLKRYRQQN